MVERERVDSAHITPSAHYTGYVWFRHRLAEPAFATVFGRWVHGFVAPINWGAQLGFGLNIEDFLLQRHLMIDARLTQAVEREGVVQVVEMACGLAARATLPATLSTVALPGGRPAADGRAQGGAASRAGLAGPGARGGGYGYPRRGRRAQPRRAVRRARSRAPLVVITEGLVNYFQRPVIEAFWSRLATELKRFPRAPT